MSQGKRIVVAGGGRIGLRTARELAERGHDIALIEKDTQRSREITAERVAMVLQGDATAPSVLEQAEVERADAVAALTDDPGTNLAVCLEAKRLAPDARTLVRTDTGTETEYDALADATLLPSEVSAGTAADILSGDGVWTLVDSRPDIDILEVEVAPGAPVAGRRLDSVRLPRGCLVISDREGSGLASPETELQPGRRYVLGVEPDVAEEALLLFRG